MIATKTGVTAEAGSVRFVTFGCKANQYDTQVLREALARRGWHEEERDAELVVINTCTVTAEAARKAKRLARRLGRQNPDTRIAMTGCLAESEPELLREIPGVHWVLGNGEAKRPVNFLRELGYELDPEELGIPAGITEFSGHTRAFLKIQDGCDMACAFCIIPMVRGPSRSRPAAELVAEVTRLLAHGHREIVLCGIHIGHWGRDLGSDPRNDLGALLNALCTIDTDADYRIRLSSIEATEVDGPVLEAMQRHPRRIAAHLHMPLQSGDDDVLRAMNRWYDVETYLAAVERIRAALDRPAFSGDVLVGFPGEDERAFLNTLKTARNIGFARLHVFPFSPREGTAAAKPEALGRPVDLLETRERRARLSELASELADDYRAGLDGANDTLVLEGTVGLSGRYQRVSVALDQLSDVKTTAGGLVDVQLTTTRDPDSGAVKLQGVPA